MRSTAVLILIIFAGVVFTPGYLQGGGRSAPQSGDMLKTQEGESGAANNSDSLKALSLLSRAKQFSAAGNTDSARIYFMESRQICTDNGYTQTEAMVYEGLAALYEQLDIWENTLKYLLMSANRYRASADSLPAAGVYKKIADRYKDFGVPSLAADYFIRAYAIYDKSDQGTRASTALSTAEAWRELPDTINAIKWYETASGLFSAEGNMLTTIRINNILQALYSGRGEYDKALNLIRNNISMLSDGSSNYDLALLNNNAGYNEFRRGNFSDALNYFRLAEELSLNPVRDDISLAGIYANIAITYQNLGNEDLTLRYFRESAQCAVKSGAERERARTDMLLAGLYYKRGDLYNAEVHCIDCIASASAVGSSETLQICYSLYADVLEAGNDFIKALEYIQKSLSLRDSLAFESRIVQDKRNAMALQYETIEQQLKLEIADEELKDLTLRNLIAESEKRENELKLLQSTRDLERVERENLMQSIALLSEREESERRNQAIQSLEQERRIQQLELEKKDIAERDLQRQNQLLESESRQKEQELEREKEARRMAIWIAVLMVLVVIVTLWSLVSVRKKRHKLAESKKKIEEINSDLEAKNSEIVQQKELIELKNQSITDSIQYASRIQNAVLLPLTFLTDWGVENFIYFRPKDIVSGDYYWGFRRKGKIYIAAADCTGHGVPGAFMSMLGNAFLNEIMITNDFATASEILDRLRDEIIRALRQKGATGEARDGMDISLAILDRKEGTLQYAGANNPLYLVRRGELIRYQADRMPIGIHVTDLAPFTNHEIDVEAGDSIYLFSDGYADQFGGEYGKKFMYRQFQELLTKGAALPMQEQMERIDTTLLRWRGDYEQIDDILVIGFRIK
jgi:serine phosphatase RsbU (regulator of sigma subunit)